MLTFRNSNNSALLNSKLYDETTFYEDFIADLDKAKSDVLIESPFMTTRRVSMLLPTLIKLKKKCVNITINTRDPEEGDSLRLDCHKALSLLLHEGVHVIFTESLHRKVAIIDDSKLWEGSLNILSQNKSREIMRRTKSEAMCKQMLKAIDVKDQF